MKAIEGAVIRLASKHADRIQRAFKKAIDTDAIVASWFESYLGATSVTPAQARDWVQIHAHPKKQYLLESLTPIYADGYVLGTTAAKVRLKSAINKAITEPRVDVVDWETWKPGNQAAAALIRPKAGLQGLLDRRQITIDGVTSTKLNRIGTVLADALERGVSPREVSILVDQVVNDPEQALVIAQTEMSRAVSIASRELYQDSNVEQVEWLVAAGCDDCQENADASPIGIDEEFPSGDTEPPAHPNCMCSLAPYIVVSPDESAEE
jgi:hypothetical protein